VNHSHILQIPQGGKKESRNNKKQHLFENEEDSFNELSDHWNTQTPEQ